MTVFKICAIINPVKIRRRIGTMGLIKCPDCGKEVSDMAINCP